MNNSIRQITITLLIIASYYIEASPWHSDITHRPRTLYISEDLETIRERLQLEPYKTMWANEYGNDKSIYTWARREFAATVNTVSSPRSTEDYRRRVAKDAAFVYAMNRKFDGITPLDENSDNDLNPWTRSQYLERAVDYLENLDPTVIGPSGLLDLESHGPMVNNWQFRVRELVSYCQAYDLLLGSGMEPNSIIENNLAAFANNLLDKYTATAFTNESLLQRNNHKLTIGAALGMAAIVLNHHEDASIWISAGMLLIEWVCFASPQEAIDGYTLIDEDGGYAEGTHYMGYSWKKAAPFFVAMKNFKGNWTEAYSSYGITGFFPDYSENSIALQNPYFDQRYRSIYEWAMKIRLPDGTLPVMEDSPLNIYSPSLALLSSEYDFQYISNEEYPPLAKKLSTLRADYIAAGNHNNGNQDIPLETLTILPNAGSGIFRNLSTGTYLHINGKNGIARLAGAAHDQADVTHFEIAHQNEKMTIEGGYAGWNYRYDINKAENHNVILVNGYGPRPPSGPSVGITYNGWVPTIEFNTGEPSPVDGFLENAFQSTHFSYLECRSAYGQSYTRNTDSESLEGQEIWELNPDDSTNVNFTRCILYIDSEYFIMLDDINSDNDNINTYSWRLHTNITEGINQGTLETYSHGGRIVRPSGTKLLVHTDTPDNNPQITIPLSQHAEDIAGPDNYENHYVIQADQDAIDTDFLTVLYPYSLYEPIITSIESSDEHIGLLVKRNNPNAASDRYEIALAQSSNSLINIEEIIMEDGFDIPSIQTTASFVVISLERWGPIDSTSIRIFGKGSQDNETITINGQMYNLITDPENLNIEKKPKIPLEYKLYSNYPNPFNPQTRILYDLKEEAHVNINIYNVLGQKIFTLINKYQQAGSRSIHWTGLDNNGNPVPSGLYIYQIHANDFIQSKKMILLK